MLQSHCHVLAATLYLHVDTHVVDNVVPISAACHVPATLSPRSLAAAMLETRCASLCIGAVTLEPRCASLAPCCDQCAASWCYVQIKPSPHGWPNYCWCPSHTVTFWPPRLATLRNVAQRRYNMCHVEQRGWNETQRDKNVNLKSEFWTCS
jgi:hypothetical protein